LVQPSALAALLGPEAVPAEGFTDDAYAHILAL
jgi:hypothetical protein